MDLISRRCGAATVFAIPDSEGPFFEPPHTAMARRSRTAVLAELAARGTSVLATTHLTEAFLAGPRPTGDSPAAGTATAGG